MSFSDRMGITKAKDVIQIESIDMPLTNKLWNILSIYLIESIDKEYIKNSNSITLFTALWHYHFKKTLDEMPEFKSGMKYEIKKYFFEAQWFEKYNFLEFIGNTKSYVSWLFCLPVIGI